MEDNDREAIRNRILKVFIFSDTEKDFNADHILELIETKKAEWEAEVFSDIESALSKYKFSTDMNGWEIVPKLMTTMYFLRKKYLLNNKNGS